MYDPLFGDEPAPSALTTPVAIAATALVGAGAAVVAGVGLLAHGLERLGRAVEWGER